MIAITIVPFSDLSARRGTMAAPAATPTGKPGDAIELAWKQQRDADASGTAMGLGWMIAGDGQTCQLWALVPSRSKIPASSAEIVAFPGRKSRAV
jgi:hypothetical protein